MNQPNDAPGGRLGAWRPNDPRRGRRVPVAWAVGPALGKAARFLGPAPILTHRTLIGQDREQAPALRTAARCVMTGARAGRLGTSPGPCAGVGHRIREARRCTSWEPGSSRVIGPGYSGRAGGTPAVPGRLRRRVDIQRRRWVPFPFPQARWPLASLLALAAADCPSTDDCHFWRRSMAPQGAMRRCSSLSWASGTVEGASVSRSTAALVLREGDDLADVVLVGQHASPAGRCPGAMPPWGGRAVLERPQHVAEASPRSALGRVAEQREDALLDLAPVDSDAAAAQLVAVADQVVRLGAHRSGSVRAA